MMCVGGPPGKFRAMVALRINTWVASLAALGLVATTLATFSGSAAADPGAGAGRTATTVRVGPFVLPPAETPTLPVVNQFTPDVPKPCENCFITSIEPRLVYEDGTRADMNTGVMMHHLLISEPAQTDVTCGRTDGLGAVGRRFFASGDERTTVRLPEGFGFKIEPGPWVGLMHLMNHNTDSRVVYFEALVHHVPVGTPGMKPVTPVWLDVDNCRTSAYAVPAGPSAKTWSWVSTLTGRIVYGHGHVHAGGVGLTLDNATTNTRICSSAAGYGSGATEGMVTSMSSCSWDSLGAVRAGDTLTMTSLYRPHDPMKDVMGIMLLALYETDEVNGGTKAPASMRKTPTTRVPTSAHGEHGPGEGH